MTEDTLNTMEEAAPEAAGEDSVPEEKPAAEVADIKFRNRGKSYFFDPAGLALAEGQKVVVETAKGLELGSVVRGNHTIDPSRVVQPLRRVVRAATEDDLRIEELCRQREREAYVIGKQKIAAHGLEMKLVDVECSFEGNKILFFFSSDGRVDFRELVRDLAGVFRTRIELRQIGVRDEARMLGGLGMCGRPFCCGSFMSDFAPVSTKMAKTQSMSLNPAKISGCCGRLMCCLRYEQPAYEELVKSVPKNGAFVETPDGYGNVTQVNVLRQTVKVKLDGLGDDSFHIYDADEVAAIPGGRPRDGSQPPHVLVLKPKKEKEPEPEEAGWELPASVYPAEEAKPQAERSGGASRHSRNRGRRDSQPREAQDSAARQQGRQQRQHQQGKQGGAQKQTGQNKAQNAQKKQGQSADRQERAASERSGGQKHKRTKAPRQGGGKAPGGEGKSEAGGNAGANAKTDRRSGSSHRYKPKNSGGVPKQEG